MRSGECLSGCLCVSARVHGCDAAAAVAAASSADAVVLVIGIDQSVESEAHDRTDIGLPGNQNQLIQEVAGPLICCMRVCGLQFT